MARAALATWVQRATPGFPWGTLAVNLLGSFVLGLVVRAAELGELSPTMRAFLAVGVCGAFTTFSTFSWETLALMQAGAWTRAAAYAVGSLLLGLAAVGLGLLVAPALVRLGR